MPLTTKRKQTIALLSKLRRPLNVIHGNGRFAKFNRARGNSSGQKPNAFGGIILDEKKRVLLRRPRGDFDGYVCLQRPWRDRLEVRERQAVKEQSAFDGDGAASGSQC